MAEITNGDFANGLAGWTITQAPGDAEAGLVGVGGNVEGSVSFNRADSTNYGGSIEQTFDTRIGRTETVSLDLYENNSGVGNHTFRIDLIDANGQVIATTTATAPNNSTRTVSLDFTATTSTTTIRITNTSATNTVVSDGKVDNIAVTCFVAGTGIETAAGRVPVEALQVGTLVKTMDGGFKPLRALLRTHVTAKGLENDRLRPIRISAGALGQNLPLRDLLVSRQHRMVVKSSLATQMFGVDTVLVPATNLMALPGVEVDDRMTQVEYFHLVFDAHEVVFAEGAPSESFYPGPMALAAMSADAKEEFFALFNQDDINAILSSPAFTMLSGRDQRTLIKTHIERATSVLELSL